MKNHPFQSGLFLAPAAGSLTGSLFHSFAKICKHIFAALITPTHFCLWQKIWFSRQVAGLVCALVGVGMLVYFVFSKDGKY